MQLNKLFLLNALPNARFYCSGVELSQADTWDIQANDCEVEAHFDSRNCKPNSIFFALKGQTVDGHDFVNQALQNGAVAFVVSNIDCLKKIRLGNTLVILVTDTLQALIRLASAWRLKLKCPVVGITGSIGKTSTKEILRSIIKYTKFNAYFSEKNQNTLVCLCSNLLNVSPNCNAVILEVGIDRPGEMSEKADILQPTIAIITAISFSHVKYFGNKQNIAFEKRQIFKNLKDDGIGIVNGDAPILNNICYQHPIAKFGTKTKNNVQARKIKIISNDCYEMATEFTLGWYKQKTNIKFKSIHRGMLNNVLAASTIAYFLNIPLDAVQSGIENYSSFENRFEFRKLKNFDGFMISDCYNANPESMSAAIGAFDIIQTSAQKIAVIGDMLELGSREIYWHRFVGRLLYKALSIKRVILVGNLVKYVAGILPDEMILAKVKNWQEAEIVLKQYLSCNNCAVLVKASKSIALYNLADSISR